MSPVAKPCPKRKAAVAVAAVLIVIAACFVIYFDEDDSENKASFVEPSIYEDAASDYTTFTSYVSKITSSGSSCVGNITKTTGQDEDANKVTWTLNDDDIGTYVIGVICKQNNRDGFMSFGPWLPWEQESYALTFAIDGDVTKT